MHAAPDGWKKPTPMRVTVQPAPGLALSVQRRLASPRSPSHHRLHFGPSTSTSPSASVTFSGIAIVAVSARSDCAIASRLLSPSPMPARYRGGARAFDPPPSAAASSPRATPCPPQPMVFPTVIGLGGPIGPRPDKGMRLYVIDAANSSREGARRWPSTLAPFHPEASRASNSAGGRMSAWEAASCHVRICSGRAPGPPSSPGAWRPVSNCRGSSSPARPLLRRC